jgi:glycosyltransferase involved in cell wall biosynthesis
VDSLRVASETLADRNGFEQAGQKTRPPLSLIIEANPLDEDLASSVRAKRDAVASVGAEVLVARRESWDDCPAGVEVVPYPSPGRGDRCDAAARRARGELLAFVDSRASIPTGWAERVLRLFASDPSVTAAGGPVVPIGEGRGQRISAVVMTHYLGSTPTAHNARPLPPAEVREIGASNLVVRASAFEAVGGFQSPPGANGESVRLCYKIRTLLAGRVVSDPSLALAAPAPGFPRSLLRDIALFGRSRGGLARRLPEAAPLLPYGLPSLASLVFCVAVVTLVILAGHGLLHDALIGVMALVTGLILVPSLRALRGPGSLGDRLLAGLALPAVVLVYGATFLRGYLGPSLEDVVPSAERHQPLRVLVFNWRDVRHPQAGGAEAYMHEIARQWIELGMEVGWITQRHPGSPRVEVIDRIRIHRVGGRFTQYPLAALIYLLRLRGRYDVLVDCANGIPFFTALYSRRRKVLVVHHVHQATFQAQLPAPLRWLALWLEGWLMPRLYRSCITVTVSEATRADLVALGFEPDSVRIVTNGVFVPRPFTTLKSELPTVVCLGRLVPTKSVDVLIRSMSELSEAVPNVRLSVVGQGPERRRLERLAWSLGLADRVRFHGWVPAEVRDALLGSAWVACCPSRFEGWGLVCMEAAARGLPVVASDVAGLRESVLHGETGLLVPWGDPHALAEALARLLGDARLREQMGEAGRRWAAEHSWDASARAFAGLLGGPGGRRRSDELGSPRIPSFASWG